MQFVELWTQLQGTHLIEDIQDDIIWTILVRSQYSTVWEYNMHFFGAISTYLNKMVSKI
jgi:hypothetical protein